MDENFSIDLQEEHIKAHHDVQLPLNFVTIGKVENDDVKVYIKQDIYKRIERFASSNTSKELGSILFGEYSEELGKMNVVISEFIEAKYTDASASTLTFTHETWDYINKEHDSHYAQLKMLGWQHTHPNYGIFLSNYDMFIQENFFNMPFQIAYVVDPIQNIRGFFQWKAGKIEKLKGYFVYDDVGKPIKIEQTKKTEKASLSVSSSKRPMMIMLALLIVSIIVTACLSVSLINKLNRQQIQQNKLQQMIDAQDLSIKTVQNNIDQSKKELDTLPLIKDLEARVEAQQTVIDAQEETLNELRNQLPKNEEDDAITITFKPYTVLKGDCLAGICSKFGIDYQSNIKIIKEMNQITDVDAIYVGQTILLPIQAN